MNDMILVKELMGYQPQRLTKSRTEKEEELVHVTNEMLLSCQVCFYRKIYKRHENYDLIWRIF